ncbi:MAG: hypothetical protein H6995_07215 [Pseudomonadales bacterium]|nr:hypothetical protein [Pseudomonadales bacterium]MCP5214779.1 hypothetical protein [Pseudomonadales bacterium]
MTSKASVSLKPEQLLSISAQALYKTFFETARDQSKQIFKELEKGKTCSLYVMKIANGQEIQGKLSLDKTEFVGKINYSAFRAALEVMVKRIADKINKKEDLNIFTNEDNGELVFHIPGFVENDGQVNILVLGVVQQAAGVIGQKLMFLDPTQFAKKDK